MGCLYKLTSPSGKSYIGISSKTLDFRWRQHKYNANKGRASERDEDCAALYSAMRKYPVEQFGVEVLMESDDWEILKREEIKAIAHHGTFSPGGYNLTRGGDGVVGSKPTEATRRRMSVSAKRNMEDAVYRKKRMDQFEEVRKIGRAKLISMTDAEKRERSRRLSEALRLAYSSPRLRKMVSDRSKSMWSDPRIRRKVISRMTGAKKLPWTEARKLRASQQRLKDWKDPEIRNRRINGMMESTRRRSRNESKT